MRACRSLLKPTPFTLSHGATSFINGAWVPAASRATFDVRNPATGAVVGTMPEMGAAETTAAVAAAKAALPGWSATPAGERGALLRRLHDAMKAETDRLAALLTLECGKPFEEAKGEIAYAASFLEWYAEEARRGYGEVIPSPRADRRLLTTRVPVGVAALLTPWNFSSAMVTRKLAPALAAGCTTVLRPSAATPLSAIAIAELAERVGAPKGTINVVVGDDHDAIAGTLCRSRDVAKISFTGSTRVGRLLMAQAAPTLKRLSMELGGNAPFIVFADADVDAAVEGAVLSKFRNAGQTCVCANRMYVHASLYDEFAAKLAAKVRALVVGDGMAAGTQVGPLISTAAVDKVASFVDDAVAKGARVLVGGARHNAPGLKAGAFYLPTVLADAPPDCLPVREEIFGPVAPLVRFTDEAAVLEAANSTEVGLAGYFFTRDLSRAFRVADALQVGMVGVNTGIISLANAPFGGVKQSGFGREGARQGMDEYTAVKYVMMGV